MRPRPGWYGGSRIRFISAVAAVGLTLTGCGGDGVPKSAQGGPSKGTYVNGSSPEEFCSVLEGVRANFSADIVHAGDDAMLTAINTINDIEPLAPEEAKADLSGLRLIMRAVVDANGSDTVATMDRTEAGEIYTELSDRVSASVAEICGFPLT